MMSNSRQLHEAAGDTIFAGFAGTVPPDELRDALAGRRIGGVVLFKRNLVDVAQCAELLAHCDVAAGGRRVLAAVDQEGGRVARLARPVVKLPPMRRLAGTGDPDLVRRAGAVLGAQLAAIGFDIDFAPVLDVDTNSANPVIGDRAFGSTPEEVIRFAFAFAEGLASSGVHACGKHFPGHGDTHTDSHLELPRLTHDRARLERVELAPFRAARGTLASLMTAHVVFEVLDATVPATLSRRIMTDLLRGELGYEGVVFSDDLEMKAVSDHFGVADAAVRAIAAGCDAVLICSKPSLAEQAHAALVERAVSDSAFAARLIEASGRVTQLRPGRRARVLGAPIDSRVIDARARAIEEEIARRIGEDE